MLRRASSISWLVRILVLLTASVTAHAQSDVIEGPTWSSEANQPGAAFGWQVATAGDVDGDGFSDLIVGVPFFDNGEEGEGAAFLYAGSPSGFALSPTWSAEGDVAGAAFGWSVAGAGDVNGDGYADVIIGARSLTSDLTAEGATFLYLGSATGLSTAPAWVVEGDQQSSLFGSAVATAGDVNGDGFLDVLVGAPSADAGELDEGLAYLFLGSASGPSLVADAILQANQASSSFGGSVSTAGDVNGDGFADVLVGARLFANGQAGEGRAFAYLGSASGLSTAAWTAEINRAGAQFGACVALAGDVDGDGFSDVLVGAPNDDLGQTDEGSASLYLGSAAGPGTTPAWQVEGDNTGALLGYALATAGDVNGDGFADVVVGAPNYTGVQPGEGHARVYLGSPAGLSVVPVLATQPDLAGAFFGLSVATAGDQDGDGFAEVAIGSPFFSNGEANEGAVFVYSGSGGGPTTLPQWSTEADQIGADYGGAVAWADVNGDGYGDLVVGASRYDDGIATDQGRAFAYYGIPGGIDTTIAWTIEGRGGSLFGGSVANAGDVNGDGFVDVLIGAQFYDNGENDEGGAFLFNGSSAGLSLAATWSVEANQSGAGLGASLAGAGDVNGDGFADVILGAPNFDNGSVNEGRAMVHYGSATGLSLLPDWTGESNQSFAVYAIAVSSCGDVNGDGFSDVIVGAPFFDNGQTNEGRAFVYLGSSGGLDLNAATTLEIDVASAQLGASAASAGDVQGDGFSDVLVGARALSNGEAQEGGVFLYAGSAAGLANVASWSVESNQAGAELGQAVAPAGDVDNDGLSDVLVSAHLFDDDQADEGRVFLYLGSASGLLLSPHWTSDGDQDASEHGAALAGGGDANGDGFGDVAIGARAFDGGSVDEGRALAFLGNAGVGLDRISRQFRSNGLTPIALLGISDSNSQFRVRSLARSALGRARVRHQVEVKPLAVPFDGTALQQGALNDTGVPTGVGSAVVLDDVAQGLDELGASHWRLRAQTDSPLFPWSPWFSPQGNGASEADLRAPDLCAVAFTNFGVGLAGSGGLIPEFTGSGSSCGNEGFTLTVANGLGGAITLVWLSVASTDVPAFGGHFYISLAAPNTRFVIALSGPAGVPGVGQFELLSKDVFAYQGLTVYFQALVLDPEAVFNVAMSGALQLDIVD